MTSQRAGCPRRAAPAGRGQSHPPHLIQAAHHLPRGERAKGLQRIGLMGGSSPRARGTRPFCRNGRNRRRFIPRERGERAPSWPIVAPVCGSSPLRGNGTRSPFVKETGRCLRSPGANATGFATAYSKGRSTAAARCPPLPCETASASHPRSPLRRCRPSAHNRAAAQSRIFRDITLAGAGPYGQAPAQKSREAGGKDEDMRSLIHEAGKYTRRRRYNLSSPYRQTRRILGPFPRPPQIVDTNGRSVGASVTIKKKEGELNRVIIQTVALE